MTDGAWVCVCVRVCAQRRTLTQQISVRFPQREKNTKESEVGTSRQPPSSAATEKTRCGVSGSPSGATRYTSSSQRTPLNRGAADHTATTPQGRCAHSQQQQGGASRRTQLARTTQGRRGCGLQSKSRTSVAKKEKTTGKQL